MFLKIVLRQRYTYTPAIRHTNTLKPTSSSKDSWLQMEIYIYWDLGNIIDLLCQAVLSSNTNIV